MVSISTFSLHLQFSAVYPKPWKSLSPLLTWTSFAPLKWGTTYPVPFVNLLSPSGTPPLNKHIGWKHHYCIWVVLSHQPFPISFSWRFWIFKILSPPQLQTYNMFFARAMDRTDTFSLDQCIPKKKCMQDPTLPGYCSSIQFHTYKRTKNPSSPFYNLRQ